MKTKNLIKQALVAAIYVALVFILSGLSYGDVQFRIAEVLLILVFFRKDYTIGLLIGTFLANLSSPLGVIDWVVGTGATVVAIGLMLLFENKSKAVSLVMPAIANGFIVGIELNMIFQLPLFATIASVFLGEFVVVFIGGGLLYQMIDRNEAAKKLLKD